MICIGNFLVWSLCMVCIWYLCSWVFACESFCWLHNGKIRKLTCNYPPNNWSVFSFIPSKQCWKLDTKGLSGIRDYWLIDDIDTSESRRKKRFLLCLSTNIILLITGGSYLTLFWKKIPFMNVKWRRLLSQQNVEVKHIENENLNQSWTVHCLFFRPHLKY